MLNKVLFEAVKGRQAGVVSAILKRIDNVDQTDGEGQSSNCCLKPEPTPFLQIEEDVRPCIGLRGLEMPWWVKRYWRPEQTSMPKIEKGKRRSC